MFHVLKWIFLGNFPMFFTSEKNTLFLSRGTRLLMDCKEYLQGNIPVLSCLQKFLQNFPELSCFQNKILQKLSGSLMSSKEKFSEIFSNFQRNFPVHSCLEKKNSQKIYGTFKEYFLETFWFIHVLKRIYLGKIPGNFYFWKKSLSFYLVEQGFHGLQRILSQKLSGSFMSSKENFSENFWKRIFLGNFPVLSCFERNISR